MEKSNIITDESIIEFLLSKGQLRPENLIRAEKVAETTNESVLSLLVKLSSISDKSLAEALSEKLEIPIISDEKKLEIIDVSEINVSNKFLIENKVLPVEISDDEIDIVVVDPRDKFILKSIRMSTGLKVNAYIGLPQDIERNLDKLVKADEEEESFGVDENDIEHLKDLANDAPVIRQVNNILQQAVENRASDIHIEPFENRMKVRYRIDGVMVESESMSAQQSSAIISRIKIMAKLNIAERRLPQDGRIQFRVQGKELDLRVSTVPTLWGESVVMRILDREQVVLDFEVLGFESELLARFKKSLEQPHGIILVTGPTGSGKSTTLYTALSSINTSSRKIITAEDPVEYQLEGINQIQIKSQIGLTFASALRSIVRQDPDVIMVGEMRDLETAQIAVQSALTGHLVLSTLHTNDAPSSINRMIDMGVEDYMITTTVIGVLAQRLVRKLCENCKVEAEVTQQVLDEMGVLDVVGDKPLNLMSPSPGGCENCNGKGYKGRLAITEYMTLGDEVRKKILNGAISQEITKAAKLEGMKSLYDDGILKAAKGITTLEEVLRVTQDV